MKYADNSIDEIYSSHLLEHFGKNEIIPVLREWARVLRLGGVLKMNLPNLEWCIRNWLSQPEEQRWGFNLDMIFGNQANPGEYHKTGFSRAHLECYLRRAGFDEISIADHWSHAQQCFWVTAKKKDV
jgi:predicted SAM-dependent methyltransferase